MAESHHNKRTINPAQLTYLKYHKTAEPKRHTDIFLTNVAFLKIQTCGYYALRISLSFKDRLFSCLRPGQIVLTSLTRMPHCNDQMKSASVVTASLGSAPLPGISSDSGHALWWSCYQQWPQVSQSLRNWSSRPPFSRICPVQNHHLKTCHPWGMSRPDIALRECRVKCCFFLPSVQSLTGHGSLF